MMMAVGSRGLHIALHFGEVLLRLGQITRAERLSERGVVLLDGTGGRR